MELTPTTDQLQVPGSFQSYAQIFLTLAPNAAVTRNFTAQGEPEWLTPDAGIVIWRYKIGELSRYGQPIPITMQRQFIFTDYPQLEIDKLVVVLRFGVSGIIAIRRIEV